MLVMVPLVFVINGLTKHNWHGAFFFAMGRGRGMTPGLPMIVTVVPFQGRAGHVEEEGHRQAAELHPEPGRHGRVVHRKTGTLTMDRVVLERHCDVELEEDDEVLMLAYLIGHFRRASRNVMDRAVAGTQGRDSRSVSRS